MTPRQAKRTAVLWILALYGAILALATLLAILRGPANAQTDNGVGEQAWCLVLREEGAEKPLGTEFYLRRWDAIQRYENYIVEDRAGKPPLWADIYKATIQRADQPFERLWYEQKQAGAKAP